MRKSAAQRQREYRERNRDKVRARDREAYHRRKHLKPRTDEDRRYEAEWRAKNRERTLEYGREWYHANKAKVAEQRHRRYREKHPPRRKRAPEEKRLAASAASRHCHAKRTLFFWAIKSMFRCRLCGTSDPGCLDFHHRDDGEKEMNVGSAGRYAERTKLIEEVIKCDPYCTNCHRRLHADLRRRSGGIDIASADPALLTYQQKRRQFYLNFKKMFSCTACGESDQDCIDFHHVDPDTKTCGVGHRAHCMSEKNLLREIKKCRPLCSNCHRKLHYNRDRDHVYDLLTLAEIEEVSRQAREAYEQYRRANDAGGAPAADVAN